MHLAFGLGIDPEPLQHLMLFPNKTASRIRHRSHVDLCGMTSKHWSTGTYQETIKIGISERFHSIQYPKATPLLNNYPNPKSSLLPGQRPSKIQAALLNKDPKFCLNSSVAKSIVSGNTIEIEANSIPSVLVCTIGRVPSVMTSDLFQCWFRATLARNDTYRLSGYYCFLVGQVYNDIYSTYGL